MSNVWQQIFALDARYNAKRAPNHPNFRTLYIRRRNQLLKKAFQLGDELPDRKQYVKLRGLLLQKRYGPSIDQTSVNSLSRISGVSEAPGGVVPTRQADASRALVGGGSIAQSYAFVGVHHIFDQHRAAVTVVKWAHNDRGRVLCASKDGALSICDVEATPPRVAFMLQAHMGPVTGCDWSANNDLVVSAACDGSLRLWDSRDGCCLREVQDPDHVPVLACMFQPANNNMVISGNGKGVVSLINVSAGIYPKGGASKVSGAVLSLACDATGNVVWAGSDCGAITAFCVLGWRLVKQRRVVVSPGHAITCLSWRQWFSREARDPSLLVNCAADLLCLYRVIDREGGLCIRKRFNVQHRSELVRSTFCPIMSFRQGACIVTGSEDACVYFLDIERESKPIVNKLQGHACAVLGVGFNYDESLLATSDSQGLVILWRRNA